VCAIHSPPTTELLLFLWGSKEQRALLSDEENERKGKRESKIGGQSVMSHWPFTDRFGCPWYKII